MAINRKEYQHNYYKQNKDKRREYFKTYYENNKEKICRKTRNKKQ